jgi:protein TonB
LPATAFRPSAAARAELSEDLLTPALQPAHSGPLYVALGVSLVVHAVLLLIHFEYPDGRLLKNMSQPLEVVLVNSKSAHRPDKPAALAQANLDGGGNTEQALRAKTNLPALPNMPAEADLRLASNRVQQLEQEARRLMAKLEAEGSPVNPQTLPVEKLMRADLEKLTDVSASKTEVARLEAEIARQWQAYQELPKRRFVGARTQGVVYAEYVDEWRQRIERVGTTNFPPQARESGTFGTVLVTVAIKADGTVEAVEIDRSSGSPVLDAAVERIVRLAAPFKPFPPNVKRDTDILHITRNWSFTRSDLLLQ